MSNRTRPDLTLPRTAVLGTLIDAETYESSLSKVAAWGQARESRAVYFCNAHSVATARTEQAFASTLGRGDLCLPDGAPVAFMMRRSGLAEQQRVSGPDFMHRYMTAANERGESVFLYGSTQDKLDLLVSRFAQDFPSLRVITYSPPFRDLTAEEDAAVVKMINDSGARTVWVALGCPKQEAWIAEHKGRIHAVMLGVGAAFAFHAGAITRAPEWMRARGLEWLHRLASDPKRLWRRYLVTNSQFIFFAAWDSLTRRNARATGKLLRSAEKGSVQP
jgi:N-acetylglucosaminyldiphosphoundecaprenol N-acetyl-beta-D-mannosaminyltransferase